MKKVAGGQDFSGDRPGGGWEGRGQVEVYVLYHEKKKKKKLLN